MTKAELRRIYIRRRRAIPPSDRSELSQLISDALFANVDLGSLRTVNCFISIKDSGEVDTRRIFQTLWNSIPQIITTAPRVDHRNGELEAVTFARDTSLVEGAWRIPEPVGKSLDASMLDLVIVPLLCIDTQGHRVGYGKGYYDRFLKACRPTCQKVGLSFFPPVETIMDVHTADVALDTCVTPEEVYYFQSFA